MTKTQLIAHVINYAMATGTMHFSPVSTIDKFLHNSQVKEEK